MTTRTPALTRDALMVLAMINVYQPARLDQLEAGLASRLPGGRFASALAELDARDFARTISGGRVIASWKGMRALERYGLRIQTDISRMEELWERTRTGEQDVRLDDDSSSV